MFEVLKEPRNRMVIKECVYDRDGDFVCSFDIGECYGIFTKREAADIEADTANRNANESVGVFYKYFGVQEKVIGNKTYTSTFDEPFVTTGERTCVALWRGKAYTITKVGYSYDVHGNFVGFKLWSSNENVKFY